MMRHTPSLFAVALLAITGTAWAGHPVPPELLRQEADNAPLPAGGIVPSGSPVFLTATADSATFGSGTYELEIEVREASQPFQNVKTHSGGVILNKPEADVEWPGLTFNPPDGAWKWQGRMRIGTLVSSWVPFNNGQTAFEVVELTLPDILVDNVAIQNVDSQPSTLAFEIVGSFRNRSPVASGNFVWNAWLSADKVLDGGDTLIYSSPAPIAVPGNTTLTDSSPQVVLDPRPAPGTYYVLIEADPAPAGCTTNCGGVFEFNETNNVGSMTNFFLSGLDMVAASISDGPANVVPGQLVQVTVSFHNQGLDSPAAPVEFRIVLSSDINMSASDYEVYRAAVTVDGPQVFNLTIPITLPAGVQGGVLYWGLEVDPPKPGLFNPTPEAIENNNVVISANTTKVAQADFEAATIDLVHVLTGVPTRVADMGFPARFKVTVRNVGDYDAFPVKAGVIISKNNTRSLIEDFRVEPDAVMPAVAKGGSAEFDILVTVPTQTPQGAPLQPGDYYFFVQFDSFNQIAEGNEDNNFTQALGPIQLRLPASDYAVTRVEGPARVGAGEVIPLTRTIRNIGTDDGPPTEYRCFASANDIITTQDFPLAFVTPGGPPAWSRPVQLKADEIDDATVLVRVPGTLPADDYYFGCLVDPDKLISELEEANNASSTGLIQVDAQAFQIASRQLPDATLGVPYEHQLGTLDAPGEVTWTALSQLPEGITLSSDGWLRGTPTQLGLSSFTVRATAGGREAEAALFLRVLTPAVQLTITTENLPTVVNSPTQPYHAVLSAAGGSRPYIWSLDSGSLPQGLFLNSETGEISGTPRAGLGTKDYPFTVRVTDTTGSSATKALRLRLVPPGALTIVTRDVPDTRVGEDYLTDLAAQVYMVPSLATPLTWSVVAGQLPPGLALSTHADKATGILSGRTTRAGVYFFTVQAEDAELRTDVVDFEMTVHPSALTVSLASPPPAAIYPGDTVDLKVVSDATTPTTFRLFSGGLPEGVTLAGDGALSGTLPDDGSVLGRYSFVVEATDATGGKGLGAFSLDVQPRPVAQGCGCAGAGGVPMSLMGLLAAAMALARRRTTRR